MASYYSDAVVTSIEDVNRSIHNRTQYVRLVLTRPQPNDGYRGASGSPTVLTETPHYIDGLFTPNATSGVNLMIVSFDPRLVSTTTIRIFSTVSMDITLGKWTVSTSLSNLDSEFSDPNFEATVSAVAQAIVSTPAGNQFRYTLTVGTPPIDTTGEGLPFWRIVHEDVGAFNDVTEIQILEPLTPTISYFETDGDFASSFPFEEENILDACWDPNNNTANGGQFYTIRFNDALTGTATVDLGDDFSEAEAGTAAGTNDFNSARWSEDATNTQFLRVNEELSYNVAIGKGQLETTYTFEGDFDVEIRAGTTTVTTEDMWFVMRALDIDNKALISEGIGIETFPTQSGVFFSSYLDNFANSAPDATMRDLRPQWHNVASGTDSLAMVYDGASVWTVSGTETGELADATTGVHYDESTDPATPVEFIISAAATPTIGQQITFDLISDNVKKDVSVSGVLGIARSGSNWTTDNVLTVPIALGTDAVSIELFGNTDGLVNISADNYVVTGDGTFGDVAVFSIERTDTEGDLLAITPTVIEALDVIGDPSLTYNDFLDGKVQIACSSSGTYPDSPQGYIYIKINNVLYKYLDNISLSTDDGSSKTAGSTAQIASEGTGSFQWTRESGLTSSAPGPFLTYLEFDETLDILHLRTIDPDTLLDTTDDKEVLLDISDYDTNRYTAFYDQNDFDTLYYVDSSTNLQAFNIDDRISAFMAVNADDVTLAAGTAASTPVNADVINAWGEALDGKTVTFSVTGDGAVTPSSDITTGGGRATTTFTVGQTVGISTVTATVTET
jgi:hypothetical protein